MSHLARFVRFFPLLLLLAAGCAPAAPGDAVLRVRVHDTPGDDPAVTAVAIVFDRLALREKGRGWGEIEVNPAPINLLTLTGGLSTVLAQQAVQPGAYSELRLGIRSAHLVRGGVEVPIDVPSGSTSGVKLKGDLTVVPDALVELSLDFDPGKSIHSTGDGTYVLHPVIAIDGQTVTPGAATARYVAAAAGGRLTLPSGVALEIPPGALPADGTISIVKDVTSSVGGTLVGPAFRFYPSGLEFLVPVTVTLPYDPALVPPWTDEDALFLAWDWAIAGGSTVDTSNRTVTGQVLHFSLGQVNAEEPSEVPLEGVWIFPGGTEDDPYAVIVVDSWSPDILIRGIEAAPISEVPPGDPGDAIPWWDGSSFRLRTLGDQTQGPALAAINTSKWGFVLGDAARHVSTTCSNGRWRRFGSTDENKPWAENKIAIPQFPSPSARIEIWPFVNSTLITPVNRYNVVSSRTTVAWNGEFQSSYYVKHPLPGQCTGPTCCELYSKQPWSALGLDASMRYLFFYSNGGDLQGIWCNMDNPRGKSMHDIYGLLLRPRSIGSKIVQAAHVILLDGGHPATLRTENGTLVKPNSAPPEGFPSIAGLAVTRAPPHPAIVVTVTPAVARLGQPQRFEIFGSNLPSTTAWYIRDCAGNTSVTSGDSTNRWFTCVPGSTTGEKQIQIKERPDGRILYDETIYVR